MQYKVITLEKVWFQILLFFCFLNTLQNNKNNLPFCGIDFEKKGI